ncbi:MAG: ketoacyl-ACP synthase III [Planctomycetaceae bacterium]|nr:ketoacyl-ACP synthase III [Planctomycetaceae bacterium]
MTAAISAIEFHIPPGILANHELAKISQDWSAQKIEAKTGILERHITSRSECSSDLAVAAAEKLFTSGAVRREEIDFLLLCTQSPDYLLPTTACLVQERLGLSNAVGALDVNLGCSGFVYGLGLAKGLIESGQARNLLLITADTYSKFIRPQDLNVRTLFGDAAAATLITNESAPDGSSPAMGPFVYGTDGGGAENLIVRQSGLRVFQPDDDTELTDDRGRLHMNGPQIFTFTLKAVPQLVNAILQKSGRTMDDVDLFIFHQANQYMLDHLRQKIGIPEERFYYAMKHYGNTVSSTIPIALKHAQLDGRLHPDDAVMLVGFGVGYSWGATLIRPGRFAAAQQLKAAA